MTRTTITKDHQEMTEFGPMTTHRTVEYHDVMDMPSGWSCAEIQALEDKTKDLEAISACDRDEIVKLKLQLIEEFEVIHDLREKLEINETQLDQQRFNNEHNLSIDQTVADRIKELETALALANAEWKTYYHSSVELSRKLAEAEKEFFPNREKISIAHEALSYILTYKSPDYTSHSRGTIFDVARKAKDKIKATNSVNMIGLNEKLKVAVEFIEMVEDNSKMTHQHSDYYLRLCCLTERATEALKQINAE